MTLSVKSRLKSQNLIINFTMISIFDMASVSIKNNRVTLSLNVLVKDGFM